MRYATKLTPEERAPARRLFWERMERGIEQLVEPDAERVRLLQFPRPPLREFIRDAWRVVEPATPFLPNWHIDAISEHLEALTDLRIRRLLITMPPRHMKSLLASVIWPAWLWTFRPWLRMLYASYHADLTVRDTVRTRRLIRSPWYQANFGHVYRLTSDQNEKSRYENSLTGVRLATSTEGMGTGEGGDVIVYDDPHNVKKSESEAERKSTITFWDESMSTRGNTPTNTVWAVIMQRSHEGDLAGHLIQGGEYVHLCLPARYEAKTRKPPTPLGWSDPRTEEGSLLWPSRFPEAELGAIERQLGARGTASQMQQRPAPQEGSIWKRGWWRFWTTIHERRGLPGFVELPTRFDVQLQSWDMAFKDAEENDYVVGEVWGRLATDCFLLWEERGHLGFPASLRAVLSLGKRFPNTRLKLIEDKANGPAIISTLRKKIQGIVAVPVQGSKVARAEAASAAAESGQVYLPDPAMPGYAWVEDFIEELATFPNAVHDDRSDAAAQAILRLTGKHYVPTVEAVHF